MPCHQVNVLKWKDKLMTMILRYHDTVPSYIERSPQPTKIVHYMDAHSYFWHYSLTPLYNDQITSVIGLHGIYCDSKGWVWDERDDQL